LPRELLALASEMDLMVAMRFHAVLFAARSLVPSIGIAYDDKVQNLADSLQLHTLRVPEIGTPKFGEILEAVWAERNAAGTRLQAVVTALAQKAEANIDTALELLVD
jgi:polysaccharide pyruvyl transferase WcaK-like protein